MKRLMWEVCLAQAALALLYFSGPVVAKDQVPFKGTLVHVPSIEVIDDCNLFVTFEGGGQATHLGRYTISGSDTTNLCASPLTATGGVVTLTAANGDQLFGTYAGVLTPDPSAPDLLNAELTITINGGTGRFENASGSIHVSGVIDTVADLTTATLEGAISFVGSNKH